MVTEAIAANASFERANAIPDKATRAEALLGLLDDNPNSPILPALAACGKDAMPTFDHIFADPTRARLHFAAIHSLVEIDDPSVDAVLVKVVERETALFKTLGAARDDDVRTQQLTTLVTLQALQTRKPESCRGPVTKLREQLAAAALPEVGLNTQGLTVECDKVLEALGK